MRVEQEIFSMHIFRSEYSRNCVLQTATSIYMYSIRLLMLSIFVGKAIPDFPFQPSCFQQDNRLVFCSASTLQGAHLLHEVISHHVQEGNNVEHFGIKLVRVRYDKVVK